MHEVGELMEACPVSQAWTVRDREGNLLPCFTAASRLEVERRVVPTHYDAFRLHVSSSYREIFARDVARVLAHKDWQVVRIRGKPPRRPARANRSQRELTLN